MEPEITVTNVTLEKPQKNTIGTISLICALIAFILNPLYILPSVAFILGIVGLIVGLCSHKPVGTSVAGLILSIGAYIVQIVVDTLITIITLGFGAIFFLI